MIQIVRNGARDLRGRATAIAAAPNQRRGLIQAMGQIAVKVINESFVRQGLYYQPGASGSRFI
jgi:hypothetical protein